MSFPRIVVSELSVAEVTRIQLYLEMNRPVVTFVDWCPVSPSEDSPTVRAGDSIRLWFLVRVRSGSVHGRTGYPDPGMRLGQGQSWRYRAIIIININDHVKMKKLMTENLKHRAIFMPVLTTRNSIERFRVNPTHNVKIRPLVK